MSRDYQELAGMFLKQGYRIVCIVTTTFPPYPPEATAMVVGGATVDLISLEDFLRLKGFHVFVVALDFMGKPKDDPPNVYRVGNYFPYSLGGVLSGVRFISDEILNPSMMFRLWLVFRKINPDVIVVGDSRQFGFSLFTAAFILRIPLFLRYDWICPSFPENEKCNFTRRFLNCGSCLNSKNGLNLSSFSKRFFGIVSSIIFLMKVSLWKKQVRAILAVNDFYKNYYVSYNVPREKIFVVRPGRKFAVSVKNSNDDFLPEFFKVLFVGRLSREKGVFLLLDAFKIVVDNFPDVKLVIAGDGPLRREVVDFSKKFEPNVLYLGWVEQNRLGQVYASANVVVIPSIVPEGHPIVADEAIQFGKTIIGFGLGGLNEVFQTYANSVKVSEVSAKALAYAISQACVGISSAYG